MNLDGFSIFWSFLMKLGDVGRVLNNELVGDNAGESEEVIDDVLGVKAAGSGGFRLNIGEFSVFWSFLAKPAIVGRVLKAETTAVDSRDSVGSWDSKTARNNTHFP